MVKINAECYIVYIFLLLLLDSAFPSYTRSFNSLTSTEGIPVFLPISYLPLIQSDSQSSQLTDEQNERNFEVNFFPFKHREK